MLRTLAHMRARPRVRGAVQAPETFRLFPAALASTPCKEPLQAGVHGGVQVTLAWGTLPFCGCDGIAIQGRACPPSSRNAKQKNLSKWSKTLKSCTNWGPVRLLIFGQECKAPTTTLCVTGARKRTRRRQEIRQIEECCTESAITQACNSGFNGANIHAKKPSATKCAIF